MSCLFDKTTDRSNSGDFLQISLKELKAIKSMHCLRFFEESKATTDKEKSKDAVKTIIFIFTHIMEKVGG